MDVNEHGETIKQYVLADTNSSKGTAFHFTVIHFVVGFSILTLGSYDLVVIHLMFPVPVFPYSEMGVTFSNKLDIHHMLIIF